jgi:hypothetical protein
MLHWVSFEALIAIRQWVKGELSTGGVSVPTGEFHDY